MATRIEGLEAHNRALKSKLRQILMPLQREANRKSAEAMAKRLRQILRRDKDAPHLADTVKVEPVGETGWQVSVGDPVTAPYPLHLEAGHMGPDGRPVPGVPAYNPAQRIERKAHKARSRAAYRKGVRQWKADIGK